MHHCVLRAIRSPRRRRRVDVDPSLYMVYDDAGSGNQPTSTALSQSLVNALVIVSVICVATFVMVLCYKYRCLKLMVGYLIFASVNLLGYTGGFMVYTAIDVYNVTFDWVTMVFLMYNFALVGVLAVFWQKGTPRIVTQSYLVAVSVIMAWIITKLPEFTAWALLIMLALYDLCAVLTLCGPLKALINLAQKHQDPIPGLLYEADVGGGNRPGQQRLRDTLHRSRRGSHPQDANSAPSGDTATVVRPPASPQRSHAPQAVASASAASPREAWNPPGAPAAPPPSVSGKREGNVVVGLGMNSMMVGFGASILSGVPSDAQQVPTADPYGGEADQGVDDDDEEEEGNSIKLGLGDFVFYSVLVSRAALFDFTTMAVCFVGIIMGLAGTLVLLAVFRKALPALPISIFLGVIFYIFTRLLVVPYVGEFALNGYAL